MIHSIPYISLKAGSSINKENNMEKEKNEYIAYTDGSCDNMSPYGEGGSAYILMKDGAIVKEAKKGFVGTTNNRMEMLAIISAVCSTPKNADLIVYTDSQYCITAFTNVKKPKKNLELINLYHHSVAGLNSVEFRWVKGHNVDEYNELVDSMAVDAYKSMIEKYNLPKTRVRR